MNSQSSQDLDEPKSAKSSVPTTTESMQEEDAPEATFEPTDHGSEWHSQRNRILIALENILLAVEHPVNRIVREPQLNPFYYTGQVAVFVLLVVGATGLYLTLFYQLGFTASYNAIVKIDNQFLAREIRALHRYASGSLIIVSLIHAFRLFVMDRFRGARWLAWVSGVVLVAFAWFVGVTGYLMIWDVRAQAIIVFFTDFLRQNTPFGEAFALAMLAAQTSDQGWVFMFILLTLHVVISLGIALFFWFHIMRLNRPKWTLERHWLIGLGIILVLVSIVVPVGMLPKANVGQLPNAFYFDPIYLFFFFAGSSATSGGLWLALTLVVVLIGAMPWLKLRQEKPQQVMIDKARCSGCAKCVADCPYKAITLLPRTDGRPYKSVAQENLELCVGCGVCIGSCDTQAISLTNLSAPALWQTTLARVAELRARTTGDLEIALTCERHASRVPNKPGVEVIALPCIAAAHPDLVGRLLTTGATQVHIVGCPPEDCGHREGNTWMEARLTRQRAPRLRKVYADSPIFRHWLPPDEFPIPVVASRPSPSASTSSTSAQDGRLLAMTGRRFLPAFVLIAVVFAVQALLTNIPTQLFPAEKAIVQLALVDPMQSAGPWVNTGAQSLRLVFEADGRVMWERRYSMTELKTSGIASMLQEFSVAPGEHHFKFYLVRDEDGRSFVLDEQQVSVQDKQIVPIGLDCSITWRGPNGSTKRCVTAVENVK
ncbi:MAG: cytochrome b N-terminal domain-containing protein [Chloroflexi bacterium]|nr:cytochrome b N-terminal domain-containing protein [Chloroflexota bacterium]